MAKVKFKNEESLKDAKQKLKGIVEFRQTKYGVVAAEAKWPRKKKAKIRKRN